MTDTTFTANAATSGALTAERQPHGHELAAATSPALDLLPLLEVLPPQVVLQEVPGEVSLAFTVLGCPHRCRGCHSPDIWRRGGGEPLDGAQLGAWLARYAGLVSCVCFMGGDWQPLALRPLLRQLQQAGLKTCLYAGSDTIDSRLLPHLDYLKLGPFIAERGGLACATTNQRFYRLPQWQLLNHLFHNPR